MLFPSVITGFIWFFLCKEHNMTRILGGRCKIFKYGLDVFRGWKTEEQYIDLQDPR
jgi:hypothetical protein